MKDLNLANKLTILRVLLIPVFVVFMLVPNIPYNYLFALLVFILASVTDWLDGHIARKYNMVTDLGKFLDPLADKVLVISALICLVGTIPSWTVIVIVAREFVVTGFRLAVVEKNSEAVIAADMWGKVKTAFTMFSIVIILFFITLIVNFKFDEMINFYTILYFCLLSIHMLIYACVALTVLSGASILWKNRKLLM